MLKFVNVHVGQVIGPAAAGSAGPIAIYAHEGRLKVKVKVHTLDIALLRSESPPQKRSGMVRVLKGSHSFT